MQVVPVTYRSVAGFCCRHVVNNKGSTKSIDNIVSALRSHCKRNNRTWLSNDDHYQLRLVLNVLKYEDVAPSKQKRPIQLTLLNEIISRLNLENKMDIFIALMLVTGHDGLLRTGELLSARLVTDVIWSADRKAFRIRFSRSKTYLEGEGFYVPFRDYGKYSAVRLMKLWFDINGLWNKPTLHIFPGINKYGVMDFSRTISANTLRKYIKKEVLAAGLDPKFYSGHSLRAGGATDLFLARVPYYLIKKMGRWKSDAAMLYHRDDEDMEEAVYQAFKKGKKIRLGVEA